MSPGVGHGKGVNQDGESGLNRNLCQMFVKIWQSAVAPTYTSLLCLTESHQAVSGIFDEELVADALGMGNWRQTPNGPVELG